ncbi:hypothetical protein GPL20_37000 [Bradyrhizobium cajani]|uniref:Uncharacterized protein n=1 Tax=Bradyrhizobium cajani TaxID=1928661 RepID=A0A844TM64_9BRAD|nr:hypothetical protein [Bradyrhizobium cajani]
MSAIRTTRPPAFEIRFAVPAIALAERIGRALRKPTVEAMLSYSTGELGNKPGEIRHSSMWALHSHARNGKPNTFVQFSRVLTEEKGYDRQQTYDLGRCARLQRQFRVCRSLQHGEPRCRIGECPRLYRTNHWFHSS